MAGQSTLKAAVTALRKVIGRDKKHAAALNAIRDAFGLVEVDALSAVELSEHTTRLVELLSEQIPAFHKSRAQATLAFCAVVAEWMYKNRLEPALLSSENESAKIWEDTLFHGLMQPILTVVDSEDQDTEIACDVLYPMICEIMRSEGSEGFGGRFARSLSLVLVCTCSTSKSKAVLLDPAVFGTETLSKLVINAKDYHHLDTLLELSFIMFSSQNGTVSRKVYAKEIFASDHATKRLPEAIYDELASIHAVTNGDNSEKHVLDMIQTMSRARVDRPQVFVTQDLSYCGTKYTQRPPSNVLVTDNTSICVIICDTDNDTDVLVVYFTTIKSIELIVQDASRILVEFMIAEPPLISSIRTAVKTPDGHTAGAPLRLRVSIASSDIFGFEAALAARNLASTIIGDNILTRQSSLASVKVSNAASRVVLRKANVEQADELMRKYVNMPSSVDTTSPPPQATSSKLAPSTREASKPQVLPRSVAPAAVPKQPPPKEAIEPPIEQLPVETKRDPPRDKPVLQVRPAEKATPAGQDTQTQAPAARQTLRTSAIQATKVIETQALGTYEDSELSDVDVTPEQPRCGPATDNQAGVEEALPAPKVLVPSTPVNKPLPDVSSPISESLPPTPKPTKRKRAEEDPIQPSIAVQDPKSKKSKKEPENVISNSQYIVPRNTAATRAKAKYTTNKKRDRIPSSESIPEAVGDAEPVARDEDLPVRQDSLPPGGEHRRGVIPTRAVDLAQAEEDLDGLASLSMRSTAATKNAKPQPARVLPPEMDLDVSETVLPSERSRLTNGNFPRTPEMHKPPSQLQETLKYLPSQLPEPVKLPVVETEPCATHGSLVDSESILESKIARIKATHMPVNRTREIKMNDDRPSSDGDELMEALSQAAKKARRTPYVEPQPERPRSPSPVVNYAPVNQDLLPAKRGAPEDDDEVVGVARIDVPEEVVEVPPPKPTTRQTRAKPTKVKENPCPILVQEPPVAAPKKKRGRPPKAKVLVQDLAPILVDDDDDVLSAPSVPVKATLESEKVKPDTRNRRAEAEVSSTQVPDPEDTRHLIPEELPLPSPIRQTRKIVQGPKPKAAAEPKPKTQPDDKLKPPVVEEKASERLESPKTQIDQNNIERIQQLQTPAAKFPPALAAPAQPPAAQRLRTLVSVISVESGNTETEEDTNEQELSQGALVRLVHRPTLHTIHVSTPISIPRRDQRLPKPAAKPTLQPAAGIQPKPDTFTRILRTAQPSPKSALASPQKRTLPGGGRPSVTFADSFALRRGSSDVSMVREARKKKEIKDAEREKLLEGTSARTGGVMMQIVEVLDAIQATIASNLGEKVQTITSDAHNARTELAKAVMAELDSLRSESEHHYAVFHELEGTFATQAHTVFKGFERVDKCNGRIDAQVQEVLVINARAGQRIAKATIKFELPEVFSLHLPSETS
ncbi:hypothetical protein BDV93DRAFT_601789 [Ceratobasidium sp. AG-I]|nr:hypothetical protein BDV93DRAFT_601789 [Ceratobasidium sp. AG-I]